MWKWVKLKLQRGIIDPATLLLVGLSLAGLIIGTIAVKNTTQRTLPRAEESAEPTSTPVPTADSPGNTNISVTKGDSGYRNGRYFVDVTVSNNGSPVNSLRVSAIFPGGQDSHSFSSGFTGSESVTLAGGSCNPSATTRVGYSVGGFGGFQDAVSPFVIPCEAGGPPPGTNPIATTVPTSAQPTISGTYGQCSASNYQFIEEHCTTQAGMESCDQIDQEWYVMDRCRQDASCRTAINPQRNLRCFRYKVKNCQACQGLPRPGGGGPPPGATSPPGGGPPPSGKTNNCSWTELVDFCNQTDLNNQCSTINSVNVKHVCTPENGCSRNGTTGAFHCKRYRLTYDAGSVEDCTKCEIPAVPTVTPTRTPTVTPTPRNANDLCNQRLPGSPGGACRTTTQCSALGHENKDAWERCPENTILCCQLPAFTPTPTSQPQTCIAACGGSLNQSACSRISCSSPDSRYRNPGQEPNDCRTLDPNFPNCCCLNPAPTRSPTPTTPPAGFISCTDSDAPADNPYNSDYPYDPGVLTFVANGQSTEFKDRCFTTNDNKQGLEENVCLSNPIRRAQSTFFCSCTNNAQEVGYCPTGGPQPTRITNPRPLTTGTISSTPVPRTTIPPIAELTSCQGITFELNGRNLGEEGYTSIRGRAQISYPTRRGSNTFPVTANDFNHSFFWGSNADQVVPIQGAIVTIAAWSDGYIPLTKTVTLPNNETCNGLRNNYYDLESDMMVLTRRFGPSTTPSVSNKTVRIRVQLDRSRDANDASNTIGLVAAVEYKGVVLGMFPINNIVIEKDSSQTEFIDFDFSTQPLISPTPSENPDLTIRIGIGSADESNYPTYKSVYTVQRRGWKQFVSVRANLTTSGIQFFGQ